MVYAVGIAQKNPMVDLRIILRTKNIRKQKEKNKNSRTELIVFSLPISGHTGLRQKTLSSYFSGHNMNLPISDEAM